MLKEHGNIEVFNRPVLDNKDGTYSTSSTISINDNGLEVLIPTVIDGKRLTEEQAIKHYYDTGEHFGKFNTVKEADDYAVDMHNAQERYINSKGGYKNMITDQKSVGVPSATRARVQLTNPVQTNNSGLTNPVTNNQSSSAIARPQSIDPQRAISAMTSEKYNPIQAKANPNSNNDMTSAFGARPAVSQYSAPASTAMTGAAPAMTPSASQPYQDLVETLGKQFSGMTEEQQIRFLNNIANGSYSNKSNGGIL